MPSNKAAADELASENLDGTHAGAAINETALRRMQRLVAFGQALAPGRCEAARATGISSFAGSHFWPVIFVGSVNRYFCRNTRCKLSHPYIRWLTNPRRSRLPYA